MTNRAEEFQTLMTRLRSGSQDAVQELIHHYGPHILKVVRRRLPARLRSRLDSIDVTQDVWASFFAIDPGHYTFATHEELLRFLVAVTQNRLAEVYHHGHTRRRDATREQALDELAPREQGGLRDQSPTPSQVAVAKEQFDRLAANQPAHHREILRLLSEGYTHDEVAERLGYSRKTVQRLLERLQGEL